MSNYTKTTNFAAKDSLPSGNAAKIVKGTEIDTEFNNIATASATKANTNNAALTGTTTFETISDGTIGITAFVDEDNMASDSATLLPTQQSVKAYVDSQVTAQDLDVTDGSTSIDIDLDSESLGILGGTGIDSTASGTGVTLAIDATVATLAGSQTLTNKTLSTPVVSGNLTTDGLLDGRDVAADGTKLDGIESGATADQTAAEIKTAYESNADTNAFTDADESKLDGIEASADVTDTANVTSAGALMDSELTSEASVKALNQGVATGDSPTFAGVTAPVTGNVTGNLTGNVTGDVTGDLTGDVTGNVTGNLTGSILTAAQTNITSVGQLSSLTVDGSLTANSLTVDGSNLRMIRQASGFDPGDVFTVLSSSYRIGVRTASPAVTLDLGAATDAVHVPVGTTAQRPTGAAGMFRYNSTTGGFEGYTDAWGAIAGGGGGVAPSIDTMTGDGSDTTLTLTNAPTNENATFVTIDGVVQHKDTYSVSGTTLTFTTAPPNGSAVEAITLNTTSINTASILQDADGDTKVQVEESSDEDKIRFDTAGTERMIIDSTGVGIGNSSPSDFFSTANNLVVGSGSGSNGMTIYSGTGNIGNIFFADGTSGNAEYSGYLEYSHADDSLRIAAAASEAIRINSSGNVGIGTSSPRAQIELTGDIWTGVGTAADPSIKVGDNNTGFYYVGGNVLGVTTNGAERARFDSAGNLLVGTTATNIYSATSGGGVMLDPNGPTTIARSGNTVLYLNRTSTDGKIIEFRKNGTTVGSISTNGNSLPSDRNFKTNIKDLSLGLNFISSLEPVTYNYKIDDDGAPVMTGLIAQDVETALAAAGVEANSTALLQHNPTEDEKESDYQMDYIKLVPVLINAVKELTERLEQLENN